MKKLCKKIIFTFILSACMMSIIHADNLNGLESRTIDFVIGNVEGPIYDYDVSWDSMNFIYTETESYDYNETTNEYDKNLDGSWSSEDNSIEVLNNGALPIDITLSYSSINSEK